MRAFLVLVVAVALGAGVSGCAKKEAGTQQASGENKTTESSGMMPDKNVTSEPGTEAVPMTDVPEVPVEGLSLDPYFDEAGTKTEVAVKPGEQFKLYIMAHTVEPYATGSAQLRLQLPPGINVIYTIETDHKLSSLGRYDFNYMIAYDCTPPGRFVVVSYVLQAADDFKGGEVEVLPGFLSDNATFLGFATCEFTEVRASGGKATIKLKK
ncbi:MAG TPA: hypothetical protein VFH88_03445 [Candidatus Krumholzibacteria bacterium]|nr:hypothetical protein [Candidatus Krumholzibacteria bacterium]